MGEIRYQDLLVSWQALKMTFAIFPGICLVVWAGYWGWSRNGPRLRILWTIWRDLDKAKHEGLKELARTFVPLFSLLAYLLLLAVLFLIPADTLFLLVINICAIPAAILSYREGRRVPKGKRGSVDYTQFDLPWPALLRVMGLWLVASIAVLLSLYAFGVWHPA